MDIDLTAGQIHANRLVFYWCVRSAERALQHGHAIQAARWCRFAAETAGFGCGFLSSPELEELLLKIATRLPVPSGVATKRPRPHWLHVLSRTDRIGGHNALVKRWIKTNPEHHSHSVVVLEHLDPAEDELASLANSTGGDFISLVDVSSRPLESASKLRELAWRHTDFVVLHHHMWDIVPTIAFGIDGGPPVFILNMADHLFWPGVSVADCVLELRSEGAKLSELYRGTRKSHLLPVPLPERQEFVFSEPSKASARSALGINQDATVFLTIGRASKFVPRAGIDFLATARALLREVPNSYLIAVGPSLDSDDWLKAYEDTKGRLLAVGNQADLRPYHSAADIYLEGFPFGSLTALLEAGLAGLPCVRAPGISPSVFRATSPAIEQQPVPDDEDTYIRQAIDLANLSAAARIELGSQLADRISRIHCLGWAEQLKGIPKVERHKPEMIKGRAKSLSLIDAKLLRWVDGSALSSIFWETHHYGMNPLVDAKLAFSLLLPPGGPRLLGELIRLLIRPTDKKPILRSIS